MQKLTSLFLSVLLIISLAGCAGSKTASPDEKTPSPVSQGSFDAQAYVQRLEKCVAQIREKTDFVPEIALVLGSGLGDFADQVDVKAEIPYSEIEGFPVTTVSGHAGSLIFCEIAGKKVAVMSGRIHYYEGYDMKEVVLPLRVLHLLGAKTALLTHAVGAINEDFSVGDFVLTTDHISSFVPSPLIGENIDELGERFTDMSDIYDDELIAKAEQIAESEQIPVQKGVFIQVTGPQYETPTEIKMFRSLGADTVGMSTAVEAIACKHMGMRVCDVACVTNMAAGLQKEISHEEVKESSDDSSAGFSKLIKGLIAEM